MTAYLEKLHAYKYALAVFAFICFCNFAIHANAYAATAGSAIQNTAQVTFTHGSETSTLSSNTVFTTMATLVDVQNTAVIAHSDMIDENTPGYTYSFIVTNTGNAPDRFDLSAGFTNLSAPVVALWIDTNHDDLFDPATDTRVDPNDSDINLAPGASVGILVLAERRGDMALTATSLNDDPTAIVANRSATAHIAAISVQSRYQVGLRLVKTQFVDTHGAEAPGRGTDITYTLAPRYARDAGFTNVRITDAIPSGTIYLPGTLTIDDEPLTDASDTDIGAYDAATNTISVALSGADSSASQIVRFQVRIK